MGAAMGVAVGSSSHHSPSVCEQLRPEDQHRPRPARSRQPAPGPVYVGRPSSLGNPYALGRDGICDGSGDGSGEPVIAQWRRWLLALLVRRCSWPRIVADGKPSSK